MASGFLVLADGRCFAIRWHYYDLTMRAIAEQLNHMPNAEALRDWFVSLLPGPNDEGELGYGAWFRTVDQQVVEKYLDVRKLTPENQQLFHQAALSAGKRAELPETASWDSLLVQSLRHLRDLVERADRGEPPLSRSDWVIVKPYMGKRTGPGW
ncbi:MAG: hypothetical protein WBE13_21840 [Candidatus Acidiferrum sp.]